MAKKTGEQPVVAEAEVVEAPPEVTPEAVVTPPVEVPKTLTQEEVDAILAEKEQRIADLAKENENIRKTQSKVDKELVRLKSQAPTPISTQATLRVLDLLEKEASRSSEYDDPTAKQTRLSEIQGIRNTLVQTQIQEQTDHIRNTLQSRIKEAGFEVTDEKFESVIEAFEDGKFDRATRKLDKILGETKKEEPVKEGMKPQKTEAEIRAELKKEVEAEVVKKYNLAQQDTGSPSGASSSFKKTEQDYAEGKINITQYKEARKKQGLN